MFKGQVNLEPVLVPQGACQWAKIAAGPVVCAPIKFELAGISFAGACNDQSRQSGSTIQCCKG